MNEVRPDTLDSFVGQEKAKRLLKVLINAAKKRGEPVSHLLMVSGYPGVGKTTLARIVAKEMGGNLVEIVGCNLKDVDEMVSVLTRLQPNDILFIDEIHAVPRPVEEILYSAMEDRIVTVVDRSYDQLMKHLGMAGNGKREQKAKTVDLPPFTLIGASTTEGELSPPLRSRFPQTIELSPYSVADLQTIIMNAGLKLDFPVPADVAHEIAARSRSTARTAISHLSFYRDYVDGSGVAADIQALEESFELKGIDQHGLTDKDRHYLGILHAASGPVGIGSLAAALNESPATLQSSIEPYLVQKGLIRRTARGRIATEESYAIKEGRAA